MTTTKAAAQKALQRMKEASLHSSNSILMRSYFTEAKRKAALFAALVASDLKGVQDIRVRAQFMLITNHPTNFKSRMGLRGWLGMVEELLTGLIKEESKA